MAKKKIISNEQLAEQAVMIEEAEMEFDLGVESDDELELDWDIQEDDEPEFKDGETSESEADVAEPIAKELGIEEAENQNETVEVQDSEAEIKELEEFDESGFDVETAETYGRNRSEPGVLTIVNSKKNGKRATFAKDVMEMIGNPQAVTVLLSADKLAISATLPNSSNSFKLCKSGAKGIIYKTDLIEAITIKYKLDFTDKVCITFHDVEYKKSGNKVVAIITMV